MMATIFGIVLVLSIILYGCKLYFDARRLFENEYREVFNAENMPSIFDEAKDSWLEEGLGE